MTKEQQKFHDIMNTSDYDIAGHDVDYKVYVDEQKKQCVLQFKGSDSNLDWLFNLLIIPVPLILDCHYKKKIVWTTLGYAIAYKSAKNIPVNQFIEMFKKTGYTRCIRGFSFGSAMAKIAAHHLESMGYLVDELTTFGDVKCWLNPWHKQDATYVHEYVTPNDGVTLFVLLFSRDKKCKVGPKFSLKEFFNSSWYHASYDTYDYSNYENESGYEGI